MAYYRDETYMQNLTKVKINEAKRGLARVKETLSNEVGNERKFTSDVGKQFLHIFTSLSSWLKIINFFDYCPDEQILEVMKEILNEFIEASSKYQIDHDYHRVFSVFMRSLWLFYDPNSLEICSLLNSMINYNLRRNKEYLNSSDFYFRNLSLILNWSPNTGTEDLRQNIFKLLSNQNEFSHVSKMQQEVLETLQNSSNLDYDIVFDRDNSDAIEKDAIITKIIPKGSDNSVNCFIIIEPNGVWHYPRNSEEVLGKDKLKVKACLSLYGHHENYAYVQIPYYEWLIIEHQQRSSYLDSVILNSIGLRQNTNE